MFLCRIVSAGFAGFTNLPLSKFEEWSDKLTGDDAVLDAEKDVVVMCHHGMRCVEGYDMHTASCFYTVEPTAARDEQVEVTGVVYQASVLKGGLIFVVL